MMHITITNGERTVIDTDMTTILFSLVTDQDECCGSVLTSDGASLMEISAVMAATAINLQRMMDDDPKIAEAAANLSGTIDEFKNRGVLFEGTAKDDLFNQAAKVRGLQSMEEKIKKLKEALSFWKGEDK